jgi:hypothetical protein
MKPVTQIELTKYFNQVQAEYETNQKTIATLEAKQASLRHLLWKRTKPYPQRPTQISR